MDRDAVIGRLENLAYYAEESADADDPDDIWWEDLAALQYAIRVLKKEPAAPQQNRPLENNYSLIITESEADVNE